MTRYVTVLPLEPLAVGDGFSVSSWPLHVTIVPTFETELSPQAVGAAIDFATVGQAPITAVVGEDAMFGSFATVRVALVTPSPPLDTLHRVSLAGVAALGAVFDDPQFIGDGYRPHVTATRRRRSNPGDILRLSQIALVDMKPSGEASERRVVWAKTLG
jgi:hypothetical protein